MHQRHESISPNRPGCRRLLTPAVPPVPREVAPQALTLLVREASVRPRANISADHSVPDRRVNNVGPRSWSHIGELRDGHPVIRSGQPRPTAVIAAASRPLGPALRYHRRAEPIGTHTQSEPGLSCQCKLSSFLYWTTLGSSGRHIFIGGVRIAAAAFLPLPSIRPRPANRPRFTAALPRAAPIRRAHRATPPRAAIKGVETWPTSASSLGVTATQHHGEVQIGTNLTRR